MDGVGAQPEGSRERAAVLGAVYTPEEPSGPRYRRPERRLSLTRP